MKKMWRSYRSETYFYFGLASSQSDRRSSLINGSVHVSLCKLNVVKKANRENILKSSIPQLSSVIVNVVLLKSTYQKQNFYFTS